MRRSLGRDFAWLWAAYAASSLGTRLALDAFSIIAILALHAGTVQVSVIAAAGVAAGALLAVPTGPWVEVRRKRPVMIGMDVLRCAVLLSVPAAYALGVLGFAQLVAVAVVVKAADLVFAAASGACVKALVRPGDLVVAQGRFEATMWTTTALGPPVGGAAIGALGPVTTVVLNAASYLLSALGIRAIRAGEPPPPDRSAARGGVTGGWRHILTDPVLRPLFLNTVLVNALILATAPLLAVLMLRELGLAPWQYGLAFSLPCLGGLLGARLAGILTVRHGEDRVLRVAGTLRVLWPVLLAFTPSGIAGLGWVMAVEFALITCIGVFNPVFAARRLGHVPADRVARVLSAWSITSSAAAAGLTLGWGFLAHAAGTRTALALAGALLLVTPLLLPRGGAQRPSTKSSATDHARSDASAS
ncbi:MFS transporter [Actinomadura flavalba]|uniref:MFS transporter n=1 Tax=Actinomadura flavalba TaxID=1120938 RepID=UPI001F0B657E|nr:MFS transporter [Actinomadura flavalba]